MGNEYGNIICFVGEKSKQAFTELYGELMHDHPEYFEILEEYINEEPTLSYVEFRAWSQGKPEYSRLIEASEKYKIFVKNTYEEEWAFNGVGLVVVDKGELLVCVKYHDPMIIAERDRIKDEENLENKKRRLSE
jgi:hypothetical protein